MTDQQKPKPQKGQNGLDKLIEKLNSINVDNFKVIVDEPPKDFLGLPDINWWDVFNALIIPVALAFIAFGFQKCSEDNNNQIAQEQRQQDLEIAQKQREHDLQIAQEQREQDLAIAADNQEVQYLNAYIDSITDLLLQSSAADLETQARIQDLLRAETLTVLRNVNGDRKAIVVRMLYEQDLLFINPEEPDTPFLASTDLRDINLSSTWLYQVDMRRAILTASDLRNTNFSGATLDGAVLAGTNFSEATLTGSSLVDADLSGVDFTNSTLIAANLSGALLDNVIFQGASYTDENTDPDVCFSLLSATDRAEVLSQLNALNLSELTEPEKGWTLAAVVQQSEIFDSVDAIVAQLFETAPALASSIFSCSTMFPQGFDPQNHNMKLIQSF